MKEIFALYDYVKLYHDHRPRRVAFRYDPAADGRLRDREARTEWDRYYKTRLLKGHRTDGVPLHVRTVGLIGDFNGWGEPQMLAAEDGGFRLEVLLRPGYYNYKFVLNPDAGDDRIEIDDPAAPGDLRVPDLHAPGLKKSGLVVYPEYDPPHGRSAVSGIDVGVCRIKVERLGQRWILKLVVPVSQVRLAEAVAAGHATVFDCIDTIDELSYLRCSVPAEECDALCVRLVTPGGASLDFSVGTEHRLVPLGAGGARSGAPEPLVDATPEWTKTAVWYTLLPDRFRHASADASEASRVRRAWTRDWHALQPGESSYYPDIYFRRYGGNLAGLREKLRYLRDLGVNALCLTPVFWGGSYHKYDTIDLRHIDPDFGPDPAGDRRLLAEAYETEDPSTWVFTAADREFLALVRQLHADGMRVIIDGVFSHVGDQFWAFRDVMRRGRASRYFDWFWIRSTVPEDGSGPLRDAQYESFFGMRHLPKLRWIHDGMDAGARQHLFDIAARWMAPHGAGSLDYGVDGWRLDVANELPMQFWRDFRRHVKSINPDAFILGEMLGTAYEPYLDGLSLDGIINYRFGALAIRYFVNDLEPMSSEEFAAVYLRMSSSYSDSCTYSMQNVIDSHDLDRVVSRIKNKNRAYGARNKIQYPQHEYDGSKPSAADYIVLRTLIALQVVSVGTPHILYGTEAGMWGSSDPHCRKPMLWDDVGEYEPEWCAFPAHQSHHFSVDQPRVDRELFADVRELLRLRGSHPVLSCGDVGVVCAVDGQGMAVVRHSGREFFLAVFNRTAQPAVLRFAVRDLERYGVVLSRVRPVWQRGGEPAHVDKGTFHVPVFRKSFALFSSR